MRLKKRVEDLELRQECQREGLNRLLNFVNKKRNSKTSEYRGEYVDISTAFESLFSIYDNQIKSLEERVEKQEETIKALVELCKPLIINRVENIFGEITTALEKELKDLFGSEPAPKCKKGAKSSAEKCKKCGESAKTTKKTSKKENK